MLPFVVLGFLPAGLVFFVGNLLIVNLKLGIFPDSLRWAWKVAGKEQEFSQRRGDGQVVAINASIAFEIMLESIPQIVVVIVNRVERAIVVVIVVGRASDNAAVVVADPIAVPVGAVVGRVIEARAAVVAAIRVAICAHRVVGRVGGLRFFFHDRPQLLEWVSEPLCVRSLR